MSDPLDIVIDLDPTTGIVTAWNAFVPRLPIEILPIEIRRRLVAIYRDLLIQHPDEHVRQLLHGKTVGEVLRRFESAGGPRQIASGENDGVTWTLHAPPVTPDQK